MAVNKQEKNKLKSIEVVHLMPSNEPDLELVVTLDDEPRDHEPDIFERHEIEERLAQSGPVVCAPQEFCDHVANGGAWIEDVCEPTEHGWCRVIGQQLFALDFDNSSHGIQFEPGNVAYFSPVKAYFRAVGLGMTPLCVYYTDWPAYRLVFALKTVVDIPTARVFAELLLTMLPQASREHPYGGDLLLGAKDGVLGPWFSWGNQGRDGR